MAKEGLFYRFLLWRDKHIKEKHVAAENV